MLFALLHGGDGVVVGETASELSVDELKIVGQSIKSIENTLLNVRIDSDYWYEYGPTTSGPWEKTPVGFSTTAFFEKNPSPRVRIDFHKSVLPWKNGLAPYYEESFSVGYDGIQGRYKSISHVYGGKSIDRHRGEILLEAPVQLLDCGRFTGIEASLFYHFRNSPEYFPKTFSAILDTSIDPNQFLSVIQIEEC